MEKKYIIAIVVCVLLIIIGITLFFVLQEDSPKSTPTPTPTPTPTLEPKYAPPSDGLIAWYNVDSFEDNKLKDLSGNDNHTTDIKGDLLKSEDGSSLDGTIKTKIIFNEKILPPTYTFIHVAKYNGPNKKRIFSSKPLNQLSGFWNGRAGVSHFDGWKTSYASSEDLNNWLISVDTNDFYRANTVDKTNKKINHKGTQFTINEGRQQESSDFSIGEILVYNRILSIEEIQEIENYLNEKFQVY